MMQIPFSPPDIGEMEIRAVAEAMRSGWITTGPKTKEFEKRLANYLGTPRVVCLQSQTIASELCLRLLGVGPGDEVIVPAYTYTASASIVEHVGARLVLVDSQPDSAQMDPDLLAAAITERTKVIIPVDLAGIPCDYKRIYEVVAAKAPIFKPANRLQEAFGRIIVLADTAHALGAEKEGKMVGQLADFSSFSFHAVKNLTTAEGGCLTWKENPKLDDEELYRQFMLLSLHGQSKDALAKTRPGAWEYDIVVPGYKANMTDIMASIGLVQLERYQGLLDRRFELIKRYEDGLGDLPLILPQMAGVNWKSSGHLYMMRLAGADEARRNRFIELLAQKGVAANVHYKPLPMFTAYRKMGFDIKDYPRAFALYQNEVTLPLHTSLTDEMVDYVVQSVREVLEELESCC